MRVRWAWLLSARRSSTGAAGQRRREGPLDDLDDLGLALRHLEGVGEAGLELLLLDLVLTRDGPAPRRRAAPPSGRPGARPSPRRWPPPAGAKIALLTATAGRPITAASRPVTGQRQAPSTKLPPRAAEGTAKRASASIPPSERSSVTRPTALAA